nr:hypothetical protein RVX_0112 [Nitratidesulfovibrio sp. HK-II]
MRGAHVALALPGAGAGGLRGDAPRLRWSPAFPLFLPLHVSTVRLSGKGAGS